MRRTDIYMIGLLFLFSAGLLDTVEARQERNDAGNKMDASIRRLISTVDPERISKNLFYLSKDPLPYRKLNLTLPGHEKNTLYEADDYLAGKLEAWGYREILHCGGNRVSKWSKQLSWDVTFGWYVAQGLFC